jgi:hypothetical protein
MLLSRERALAALLRLKPLNGYRRGHENSEELSRDLQKALVCVGVVCTRDEIHKCLELLPESTPGSRPRKAAVDAAQLLAGLHSLDESPERWFERLPAQQTDAQREEDDKTDAHTKTKANDRQLLRDSAEVQ